MPPPVLADVDHDPDEPRFLARGAVGNRGRGPGGPQEGFLHDVPGVLRIPGHAPGQPVQPLVVGVEQGPNPHGGLVVARLLHGRGHRDRLPVHAPPDGRPRGIVGGQLNE